MGGKGKFVVIEGTPKTPTNRERVRGYKRAFGEFPGIQVLGSEVGNYQQPDAKRAMEKLMKEHPEIAPCCQPMTACLLARLRRSRKQTARPPL